MKKCLENNFIKNLKLQFFTIIGRVKFLLASIYMFKKGYKIKITFEKTLSFKGNPITLMYFNFMKNKIYCTLIMNVRWYCLFCRSPYKFNFDCFNVKEFPKIIEQMEIYSQFQVI